MRFWLVVLVLTYCGVEMSRFDSIGMFWQDAEVPRVRQSAMPPIPDTGWKTPRDFPNLVAANVLSLDTETYDPELLTHGPGWGRNKGHIVGVSIGADCDSRWYFPMRHVVEHENNMCPEKVLMWLRDTLGNNTQPKVGANLSYDLGWLEQEGVHVAGELIDVQFAEALLSENSKMDLETLGQKYISKGKTSNILYQWCADFYGGAPTGRQRANIYRSPPRLVGPYAESDAVLPLQIIQKQYPLLQREGLLDVFSLECRLIRLTVAMRQAGVFVDLPRAEHLRERLLADEKRIDKKLTTSVGFNLNTDSPTQLAKVFDEQGLAYTLTAKKNPSFTKEFLSTVKHPIAELIQLKRKVQKFRRTFIESYILNANVDGKLYGQFHQLRGDANGTRSGRYASSKPNLQNIPSRDSNLAPLIRGLFKPDPGHTQWIKIDYSQIEYRFLAHYAIGPGSNELRAAYNANPNTDYHTKTQELIFDKTSKKLDRNSAKTINFGLIYGMGKAKLAASLGLTVKAGNELFRAYHSGCPFAKATISDAAEESLETGVIKTILGRRSRFDLWESVGWDTKSIALPYQEALKKYGNIQRAYSYKALNRKLQGSASDMMKMAMLKCYEAGLFAVTGVPRLTVYDELDFSDPGGCDEAFREIRHVMETCIQLQIPVTVDVEAGPDWGHVKGIN